MADRLSYEDLQHLHQLATDNGDDYLLAAVTEAFQRGDAYVKAMADLSMARMELKDARQTIQWQKDVLIDPAHESIRLRIASDSEILRIVRDTSVKPDDKLAMIEELLTVE